MSKIISGVRKVVKNIMFKIKNVLVGLKAKKLRTLLVITLGVAMGMVLAHYTLQYLQKDVPVNEVVDDSLDDGEKPIKSFYDKSYADHSTNTIYIGEISDNAFSVLEIEGSIMQMNGAKEITIVLNSPGGSLFAAEIMKVQMDLFRKRGVTLTTKILPNESCMSACPLIFAYGDKRIADDTSVLMFHSPYNMIDPTYPEAVQIYLQETLQQLRVDYINAMSKVCGKSERMQRDIIDHNMHFYFVKDYSAKECGALFTEVTHEQAGKDYLVPKDEEETTILDILKL